MREVVPGALAGERLDRAVSLLTGCSRAEAAALITGGGVRVDGRVSTSGSRRLREGSVVELEPPAARPAGPEPDPSVEVPVVLADDQVVVVDKPAGLVVHPGAGREGGTLVHGLLARFPDLAGVGDPVRPGIVHRLDRGTSGLLVVARTEEAREDLVEQLAERRVERRYLALVRGVPASSAGLIDAPIGRDRRDPTRRAVVAGGREARTRYEVLEVFPEAPAALLACRLETGRTHQIRVHLTAIGHPVLGDDRYGGAASAGAAPRPMLHAAALGFDHPGSGERVRLESEAPADVASVLAWLREQAG